MGLCGGLQAAPAPRLWLGNLISGPLPLGARRSGTAGAACSKAPPRILWPWAATSLSSQSRCLWRPPRAPVASRGGRRVARVIPGPMRLWGHSRSQGSLEGAWAACSSSWRPLQGSRSAVRVRQVRCLSLGEHPLKHQLDPFLQEWRFVLSPEVVIRWLRGWKDQDLPDPNQRATVLASGHFLIK